MTWDLPLGLLMAPLLGSALLAGLLLPIAGVLRWKGIWRALAGAPAAAMIALWIATIGLFTLEEDGPGLLPMLVVIATFPVLLWMFAVWTARRIF